MHVLVFSAWTTIFHLNLTKFGASSNKIRRRQCFYQPYWLGVLLISYMYKDHITLMAIKNHMKRQRGTLRTGPTWCSSIANFSRMFAFLKNMTSYSTTINHLCGQNPCVMVVQVSTPNVSKAEQMWSQYATIGSWVSQTHLVMSSSYNFFQYSKNLDISLMISDPFLMGSGLQGFGFPFGSIHFHHCPDTIRVLHGRWDWQQCCEQPTPQSCRLHVSFVTLSRL